MEKIIVYSVNINGYDEVNEPEVYDPNVEYILFTDNEEIKSDVWKIKSIEFLNKNLDLRKKARYIKINSHLVLPPHDISIWMDHCFEPIFTNTTEFLNKIHFSDSQVMSYSHSERNCTYKESEIVINRKLDYPQVVQSQISRYQNEGFPENYGLFETGLTIRKNNNEVNQFNEAWWNEINKFSGRDQLSQVYSSWKTNVPITPIPIGKNVYDNPFLSKKVKHPKKWSI
jgi:hypothetical protein